MLPAARPFRVRARLRELRDHGLAAARCGDVYQGGRPLSSGFRGPVDRPARAVLASVRLSTVSNTGPPVTANLRRPNLPTTIANELRRQIIHHELRSGERLPSHRHL